MMWRIDEESNQSHSQFEEYTNIANNQQVLTALSLQKMNSSNINIFDHQQLNLQEYLDTQRVNTQANENKNNRKKTLTPQQRQMERQYAQSYGKGFKMLQGMGFNLGKGLGKNQQGRTDIVQAEFKNALTAKDQNNQKYENESQEKSEQSSETEVQNIEELFLYKSQKYQINTFLNRLKNNYEVLQTKVNIANQQLQSLDREQQLSQSFKLQKQNEIQDIDKQLQGLEAINKNIYKASKFPQLGLRYNLDLLIVKQAIEKLNNLSFNQILVQKDVQQKSVAGNQYIYNIQKILEETVEALSNIFLEKERKMMNQYAGNNISASIFKNFPKNKQPIDEKKYSDIEEIKQISYGDICLINKYLNVIIQQGIIKGRVEKYLKCINNLKECQLWILDILTVIKKYDRVTNSNTIKTKTKYREDGEIISDLKRKYIINLCNNYLESYSYSKEKKQILPDRLIFPWLSIVHLEQLNITGFMNRICLVPWKFDEGDLLTIIEPWMKIVQQKDKSYFLNFYLAPCLLYEMRKFKISSSAAISSKKTLLTHLLAYSKLLPTKMCAQVISNSIALQIVHIYKQLEKQQTFNRQQMNEWVMKWVQRIDGKLFNNSNIIRNVFQEHDIHHINWR